MSAKWVRGQEEALSGRALERIETQRGSSVVYRPKKESQMILRACAFGRSFLVMRERDPRLAVIFCRGFLVTLRQALTA